METNQAKIERLQAELDALNAESPRNETAVNQTAIALDEARKELEQEQAAQVTIQHIQQDHENRVTQSTEDFFNEIDNLEITNGMKLRDITIDESLYQSAIIAIKGLFQANVDSLSKKIADQQTENAELNTKYQKANADLQAVTTQLNQEKLDHTYTQQARDNAANLLDEANQNITQLNEQLKVATVGVKTTNTEEEQRKKAENDAKIKRERTVYNVEWEDEIKRVSYKAKLAATGEAITIPAPYIKSYPVIQESEVSQFRESLGIAETTTPTTDNTDATAPTVPDSVTPEESFPTIPTAEAPVPTVPAPVVTGQPEASVEGQVTREEFEALKAEVFELKGKVA